MSQRVALVTGGGSGIGRAVALRFAAGDAAVVIADVDADGGARTAAEIESAGGTALFVPCAVQREDDMRALAAVIEERWGRLDHAVNCAGVEQQRAIIADCTEENWDRTIDIDLKGIWLSMKHEIPLLRRAGGGAIVNTSSVVGVRGVRAAAAYVAAKHGIIGLTRCAALEEAEHGIRVNAILPGHIRTPMVERVITKEPVKEQAYLDNAALRRLGDPDEVARLATWLCGPDASFMTGDAIAVDGGVLAR
ncbi:SDR family NAD(P)-dependent oxidoreductase [Occultella aeris]|uniref:2,5-dichloro-2,5-cyclohexadiene-1,4-diol dehydrogenase n=1 Tax=Occultella aeris TaxID=2761496 RepID=A0A7M4DQR4_9MICO|nr:glucose 1-dehydrogenase [Occultella aeris]VZO39808.1 2,5-dichloro-2,5-cyclohexadiene-1,4-diol dehydrogenase [Occultella aeris]